MTTKHTPCQTGRHAISCLAPACCLASALSWIVISTACPAEILGSTGAEAKLFKLRASESFLGKTGITDSVWRYFSEQGARAYVNKDYASAEKFYAAALTNADKIHVDDRNLVLIITNLASTLREQGKYDRAEPLFKRALKASEKMGNGPRAPYAYTLRQYAALLRKTGRAEEAQFAYEAAQNGARLRAGATTLNAGLAPASPWPGARQKADSQPASPEGKQIEPIAGNSSPAPGPPPGAPSAVQSEEPMIIDITLVGIEQGAGQSEPATRVFQHSRTYLSGQQALWVRGILGRLGTQP